MGMGVIHVKEKMVNIIRSNAKATSISEIASYMIESRK